MNNEEYRAQATAWLAEHAPTHQLAEDASELDAVEATKSWLAAKHAAGYSAIAAPVEYGGAGGTEEQAAIFAEEEERYATPTYSCEIIGMNMTQDVLFKHGTEEQKQFYGKLIRSGQATVCQMFSEPAAGSDLAALRTKAVKDGDNWILNGQKVWSSYAQYSDYGLLIARTDPTVAKHKGLTFYIVDMKSEGLDVRPIRQISGLSDFNEIFLTDCAVPDANRIGAEGEGWACCMTVLSTERNRARGPVVEAELPGEMTETMVEHAASVRRADGSAALESTVVREKIARFRVMEQGLANYARRLQAMRAAGQPLPPTSPVMKLTRAPKKQQLNAFLMDLDGYSGLFTDAEHDRSDLFYRYCRSAADRVAGGTQEIMLNQLAENALGMPREPRVDKGIPFNELPG